MKYDPKDFLMISTHEFAQLCDSRYDNIEFHKTHGPFMGEFQQGGRIPRELVEIYLQNRGVGVPFSVTTQVLHKPRICCRSGSSLICSTAWKETKLRETISRLEKVIHPVPQILIWHDIFIQEDSCFLKNDYEYMYFLFHLVDTGKLIRVKDSDGNDLYSVSLVPTKRGVGRPRKYI
jgi:hypothetical protein